MKKIMFVMVMIISLIVTSCNPMNKSLNSKDFEKIKETISSNDNYSQMKKEYIIDNLSEDLGYMELRKLTGINTGNYNITYKESIDKYSNKFDSILIVNNNIVENNKKLEKFVKLIDANAVSVDEYNGYLSMELKFNNEFDKEILYIILNYKYVNKYDSEYFNEKSKLTDKIANDFKENVVIVTTEKYNDVSDFIYEKVPVDNIESTKNFLLSGLKVETIGIIFKDKTKLFNQEIDWEYFE
jgi:ribosomal protein L30E